MNNLINNGKNKDELSGNNNKNKNDSNENNIVKKENKKDLIDNYSVNESKEDNNTKQKYYNIENNKNNSTPEQEKDKLDNRKIIRNFRKEKKSIDNKNNNDLKQEKKSVENNKRNNNSKQENNNTENEKGKNLSEIINSKNKIENIDYLDISDNNQYLNKKIDLDNLIESSTNNSSDKRDICQIFPKENKNIKSNKQIKTANQNYFSFIHFVNNKNQNSNRISNNESSKNNYTIKKNGNNYYNNINNINDFPLNISTHYILNNSDNSNYVIIPTKEPKHKTNKNKKINKSNSIDNYLMKRVNLMNNIPGYSDIKRKYKAQKKIKNAKLNGTQLDLIYEYLKKKYGNPNESEDKYNVVYLKNHNNNNNCNSSSLYGNNENYFVCDLECPVSNNGYSSMTFNPYGRIKREDINDNLIYH